MAPYRIAEKPKWRSVAITHQIAANILKSAGQEPNWQKVGDYQVMPLSELRLAVAAFMNLLRSAGVMPFNVQVVFHPESDFNGDGDWRSEFTVFYFGQYEVQPP
jgi:hypothetical protein